MSFNYADGKPRHCTMEDVTISNDARTAAALYWLADWLGWDNDRMSDDLDQAISETVPQGNVNDELDEEIRLELYQDYRDHPEACVSWLTAAVATKRGKEKK